MENKAEKDNAAPAEMMEMMTEVRHEAPAGKVEDTAQAGAWKERKAPDGNGEFCIILSQMSLVNITLYFSQTES